MNFLPRKRKYLYIPNPCDTSFETLNNFSKNCSMDVFYALSHGVHRGVLKRGKFDERESFVKKLMKITPNVKFDIYGLNIFQTFYQLKYNG